MSVNESATTNVIRIQPLSCFSNPTAEKFGTTFAYCLIFAVSMAGNIFIGIIVYKTKTMRKTINFLIVNMAMSDLLFPIFAIPWFMTELFVNSWLISGPLGLALCKIVPFLQDVSTAVSIESLFLIAVDRFGAVVFPHRSPVISSKLCPFFILATWIVAISIGTPVLLAYKLSENSERLVCIPQWKTISSEFVVANYTLVYAVILVYTPLVLTAVLYTLIILKLKTHTIPGEQSVDAGQRQQRVKRERNVLKMSIAIVLGFAVCWLPFSIIVLLYYFSWDHTTKFSCGITRAYFIAQFLARANCAINPCICFIFSGNYRQGLKNLLRCV